MSQPPQDDDDAQTILPTRRTDFTPARPLTGFLLEPGRKLGSRYTIVKLLGRGGMGAVYQAWDDELQVAVAIKTILPDADADEHATHAAEERFKRELLLARQVTHKNVVRIHDLGEIDGHKYITMSYVEGETLGRVIRRNGPLPVPKTVAIAKQIADGLAAAHEVGIVHRDLKPENIMITPEGQALIMDFGIARGRGGSTETQAGTIIGTIEYMAPEQASGLPVDQRADIYAFGLIVYDMLLGRQRTKGRDNPMSEMVQRTQQAPPPPTQTRVDIPADFEEIVMQCVQPGPADRPQTTGQLVDLLARLAPDGHLRPDPVRLNRRTIMSIAAGAVLFLLLATGGTWYFASRTPVVPVARAPISVLIADFDNRTGDAVFEGAVEQALGVGIESATFITSFARRDALRVAAQIRPGASLDESVARLVSVREGVGVVLAGSVAPSGSGYTLAVKAMAPEDGRTITEATAYAADKAGVLGAVGEVAADIRRGLGDTTNLTTADETFTAASLEAARAYASGQDLAAAGRHADAIEQYRQAVALDPNFGRAYSGWATSAFTLGRRDEAESLYQKAFGLLDRMTQREKFRTLGVYYGTVARNYEKAIENYKELTSKYPSDGAGLNNLAVAYFNVLQFKEASDAGRRLLDVYPARLLYRTNYALYAMYAGDLSTAVAEARDVVGKDPAYAAAYLPIAVPSALEGKFDEADAAYAAMAKAGAQGASRAALGRADLLMFRRQYAAAVPLLEEGIVADAKSGNSAGQAAKLVALAEARQAMGDRAASVAAAQRAVEAVRIESAAFPAGVVLLRAGRAADARARAATLANELSARSRAYGKLLEGEIALADRKFVEAIQAFAAARDLSNVWMTRFDLGRAYVEAGRHAEALSELELCEQRRGEATALFLDDTPTLRYLAPLPYWLARAQEGLGLAAPARENYGKFLQWVPADASDPTTVDARKRSAALAR